MSKNLKETFCYYTRVSTTMQEEKKTRKSQILAIKNYAEKKKLKLSKEYKDVMTGMDYDRPGFKQMITELNNYKGVIIPFVDRLGRDFIEQMKVFVKLHESKVEIHVVDIGEINPRSLDDQLKYVFESYFSAKERERLIQRIKFGIERKRKEQDGLWGRRMKPIDWEKFYMLKTIGLSMVEISKVLKVGRTTLYRKLNEKNTREKKETTNCEF